CSTPGRGATRSRSGRSSPTRRRSDAGTGTPKPPKNGQERLFLLGAFFLTRLGFGLRVRAYSKLAANDSASFVGLDQSASGTTTNSRSAAPVSINTSVP